MRKSLAVACSFCLPVLSATADAQEVDDVAEEGGSIYDISLYEYGVDTDAPVESELLEPPLTFTTPQGGVFNLYGQVNLTYQSFDDGEVTTDGIVDNGNWNTRLGFTFGQPVGDFNLRARFETGLGLRNSALISQDSEPGWINWQRTALRWFEVAADSPYGSLSLGHGSSASDGTAGLDDSFTFHAGATDSSDGFGSFRFRDADGELTDVSIGRVNDSFDGARRFRARYDTPQFAGLMLSSSYGINVLTEGDDNDYYDVALRWLGDIGDVAVRSAIGYQWIDNPDGANSERVAGSVSAIHRPTGLNLAFSSGRLIDGASYYWTRAGWILNLIKAGNTSLSVDYYNGSDFLSDGAESENYGAYAVQTFEAASLDVYAGWRRFTYSDDLGTSYQDADGILVGCRFAF